MMVINFLNRFNIAPVFQAQVADYLGHWALNWISTSGVWLLGTFQLNFRIVNQTMVERYNHPNGWNKQMRNPCENPISRFLSRWHFVWCENNSLSLPNSIGTETISKGVPTTDPIQQKWDTFFLNNETSENLTLFEKIKNFTQGIRDNFGEELLW